MKDDNKNKELQENDAEYLSKEGFAELKEELDMLRADRRKEIADKLEYAKSLGDLSENSEYHQAKEEQMSNEVRIAELDTMLSRAVLITKRNSAVIGVGSTIFAQKIGLGRTDRYFLVGSVEANPLKSKISNESPLGKAFLGSTRGDVVKVDTPKGTIEYRVIDFI